MISSINRVALNLIKIGHLSFPDLYSPIGGKAQYSIGGSNFQYLFKGIMKEEDE